MTLEHSGITRIYLPTFNLQSDIPTLEDIIGETPTGELFTNHVALNHKGLNWKIFRYKLNSDNYRSFILAFALIAKNTIHYHSGLWQFEANARRLEKALVKNNINLSKCEDDLLRICKKYSRWGYTRAIREKEMSILLETLRHQYLG